MRRTVFAPSVLAAWLALVPAAALAQGGSVRDDGASRLAPRLLPGAPAEALDRVSAARASGALMLGAGHATRVLPGGAGLIRFEVQVPAPEFHEEEAGLQRVSIEGYDLHAPDAGSPALPRRTVYVAVPPVGEVQVSAEGSDAVRHDAMLLAPLPRPDDGDAVRRPRDPSRLPAAYASDATMAPARARLLGVSWMRNQRVAEIEILPMTCVPAQRTAQVWGRIRVDVSVAGAEVPQGRLREERDPFEGVYRASLVNYEQGREWRRVRGASIVGLESVSGGPALSDTSVFAGRTWVKLRVAETGFHRVTFGQLRLLPEFSGASGTPLDSLRLFTWPGFPVLPENTYCDSCAYREVAISVLDDGDGVLDDNADAIEFFAMGPSDWANLYDPARPDTVFFNNPYEALNYYYLTFGTASSPVANGAPRRYGQRSGQITNPSAPTPATFEARAHFERDLEYHPDANPQITFAGRNTLFWEKWFWRSLGSGQSLSVPFDLPNGDFSQPSRVRASVWGLQFGYDPFSAPPCSLGQHHARVTLNGGTFLDRYWNDNTGHIFDIPIAPGGLQTTSNTMLAEWRSMACATWFHRVAFAWFDVFYQKQFGAESDTLVFASPATPGEYVYQIDGFVLAAPPRVFDVTDPYAPVEITDLEYTDAGGAWRLRFQSNEPGRRRYRIVRSTNVRVLSQGTQVVSALPTSIQNLRSATLGADYLVIYYDRLKQSADSLLAWRRDHLPLVGGTAPFETMGVPISALFDQFSGGRTDPAAVRNFLRATANSWRKTPAFVTFLGDASYDFKNILGRALPGDPGSLLLSYEGGFDNTSTIQRQFASDDWMLNVDDATRVIPDFFGGRIPAGDLATANTYVRNKLFRYERSDLYGTYRNRFMLVADDHRQNGEVENLSFLHVSQTSQLDRDHTPYHVDRQYVYLHKYPDGPGFTKPGAKADIIRGINDGVAVVNYVGHGSPFKMADESVFLDTDTGALTNRDRLSVFVAASCDIGKYNDPTVPSMGERLVLEPNGGAVGVVSATEQALSQINASLNRILYDRIFFRGTSGGYYATGFAEALLAAKLGSQTAQKYQLMGDAAVRLNLPRRTVEMTIWDSAGTTPLTEVLRGQTVTVRGQVVEWPGGPPAAVNGVASLLIEDSPPLEIASCPGCITAFFYYTPGPMFRGDIGVTGGAFEGRFIVPIEGKTGPRGRLRAYVTGRAPGDLVTLDGVGGDSLKISPGAASGADDRGPVITLTFPGGATTVRPDAELTIGLTDPSGILTTGHTPQNGIIVTVDGNTTARTDVTGTFRYAADSYQNGTATFVLPNLATGPHRISVSAADNLAAGFDAATHRSTAEIEFVVEDAPPLEITRAYLFPNPIRSGGSGSGGQFVVDAPGDSVNVLIRIYTVSGRQVRVLKALGGLGQTQLPWDGRDSEGYELANGVYFFKVHLNPRDEFGESDPARKAVAEGRVVVIGH